VSRFVDRDVYRRLTNPCYTSEQANEWYNRIKKAIILGNSETVINEFVEDSDAIREEDEM